MSFFYAKSPPEATAFAPQLSRLRAMMGLAVTMQSEFNAKTPRRQGANWTWQILKINLPRPVITKW